MIAWQDVSRHSTKILSAVILILFGWFYIPSVFKWWFEDDPLQYYLVSKFTGFTSIFTDLEQMRGFSKAFVPMQILSYWIDVKLFGFSPLPAYLHSLLALTLAAALLFLVVRKWTGNNLTALATLSIWLLLPSTLATSQFIATRHYIEGLIFALSAIYLVLNFCKREERNFSMLLLISVCSAAAMLCKEIYAPLMLGFLTMLGLSRRKYALVFISIGLAIFYGSYRIQVLGTDVTYTMPFLGFTEYLKFLSVLPYTFSAGKTGYLIYLGVITATVLLMRKTKSVGAKETLFFLILLGAVLAALYPVAYAVLINYKTPGTWYRVPFIINTIIAVWGVYALSRITKPKTFAAVFLVSALLIIPGTRQTRKYWNERMARAEMEGKFYLENPDKLLYSEEDAPWFIDGVHKMYDVPEIHFITKQATVGDQPKTMILKYSGIWRYEKDKFIVDEKLFDKIKGKNKTDSLP